MTSHPSGGARSGACRHRRRALGQIAILQIQVVEGEGTVHAPGVRSAHAIAVAVTDESGRPVAGAAVSFHLPERRSGRQLRQRSADGCRDHGCARARDLARVSGEPRSGAIPDPHCGVEGAGARGDRVVPVCGGVEAGVGDGHRKWIAIAALAGGGALAGVLASGHSNPAPVPVAVAAPSVLTIGTPSISVGKP